MYLRSIAADRSDAVGFALSSPASSGFDLCMGRNTAMRSPISAVGQRWVPPTRAAASSVSMSPYRPRVRMVSMLFESRTTAAAMSPAFMSSATKGEPAIASLNVFSSRPSVILYTAALWTQVILRRPLDSMNARARWHSLFAPR